MTEGQSRVITHPPVTILLPIKSYRRDYLLKAVGSLRDQQCPEWRLMMIVERGAADEVWEVVGQRDRERMDMLLNEGRGLPGAINTGMRYSQTPFVALLFADDMLPPGAVGTLRDHIAAHPDIDFFHSSRVIIGIDDQPISAVYVSREAFMLDDFRWGSPVKHLLCWRRRTALAIGGLDESLNSIGVDDFDFPWTMAERGIRFKAIKECLYHYRNHCEHYRLTTHVPLSVQKREVGRILRKHGVGWLMRTLIVARGRWSGSLGGQCLYRSALDRWIKEKRGQDVRQNWRQVDYGQGSRGAGRR